MRMSRAAAIFCAAFLGAASPLPDCAWAAGPPSAAPIPPAEQALPAEEAVRLRNVSAEDHTLEGAIFDADGALHFCDVSAGKVHRLSPGGELEEIAAFEGFAPSGLAFHPDGRLLVAGNMEGLTKGAIWAMRPDGSERKLLLAPEAGFIPNDLAVSSKGVIYFTDFKGHMTDPAGGVYFLAPGAEKPALLMPGIANANGVALSPDEKTLWVGDYGRSILYRIILTGDGSFNRIHSTPVYYFTGRGPDSMRTDSEGNLYVAVMSQGRTLIFSPTGIPIGQILLPGREEGRNLYGASLAVSPLSDELVLVARDDKGGGANLFQSRALAKGLPPAGQRR